MSNMKPSKGGFLNFRGSVSPPDILYRVYINVHLNVSFWERVHSLL